MTKSPASTFALLGSLCAAIALPSATPPHAEEAPSAAVETGGEALSIDPIAEATTDPSTEESTAVAEKSIKEQPALPRFMQFRAGAGISYDDNIFLNSKNKQSDAVYSATAGFSLKFETKGKSSLVFEYDGTANFFQDFGDGDGVDHNALLSAAWTTGRTRLGVDVRYQHATGTQREVGRFVDRDLVSAGLTFSHDLTGKMVLDSRLDYSSSLFDDDLNSFSDYAMRLGLGWRVTAKTTLGFAGVYGLLDAEGSSEQTYQQLLLTATSATTQKLTFSGDAGIDFRQNKGADGAGNDQSLVFGFQAHYQPRERTAITLSARKSTVGSAAENDAVIDLTSFSLGIEQQFARRVSANLTGGYEISDYQTTSDDSEIDRREEYSFLRAGFTYTPTSRTSISAFYEYRNNDSSEDGIDFASNRLGLNLGITF